MAAPDAEDKQRESPETSLLGDSGGDEAAAITHLRALGITSSGFVRGAVQMGSMQVAHRIAPHPFTRHFPLFSRHFPLNARCCRSSCPCR